MKTSQEVIEFCESEIKECDEVIFGHPDHDIRMKWTQIKSKYQGVIEFIKS